jgi:predicted nucleic acid-binding protein
MRVIVPAGQIPDLSGSAPDDETVPWAYTAVDADGRPVEVAYARTNRYLIKPPVWNLDREADVVEVGWEGPMGILDLKLAPPAGPAQPPNKRRTAIPEVPGPSDTIVTVDLSVLLAGLRPTKFRPGDALFISMALATEVALARLRTDNDSGRGSRSWHVTTPVPVDEEVLAEYTEIAFNLPSSNPHGLSRADLLCAATAVVYKSPMYTTRPEAYAGAGRGLTTLAYGKTRNKTASDIPPTPPNCQPRARTR